MTIFHMDETTAFALILYFQREHFILINGTKFQESGISAVGKIHSSSSNTSSNTVTPVSLEQGNVVTVRTRSRENLTSLSVLPVDGKKRDEPENSSEVILTTARPATVISNASTASSPAPSEMKLSKEER